MPTLEDESGLPRYTRISIFTCERSAVCGGRVQRHEVLANTCNSLLRAHQPETWLKMKPLRGRRCLSLMGLVFKTGSTTSLAVMGGMQDRRP